jgi:hypothetical protein
MVRLHFIPAADESVDSEYAVLTRDGQTTNIAIQDGRSYGGGYAVNEYGPDDDFWVRTIGTARSLADAKQIAADTLAKREG